MVLYKIHCNVDPHRSGSCVRSFVVQRVDEGYGITRELICHIAFDSDEDAEAYNDEYCALRVRSSQTMYDLTAARQEFLDDAMHFVEKWGAMLILPDLAKSIQEHQEFIGLPVTEFPDDRLKLHSMHIIYDNE